MKLWAIFFSLVCCVAPLFSETIAKKKEHLARQSSIESSYELKQINDEITRLRQELKTIYQESHKLLSNVDIPEQNFADLLARSQDIKNALIEKENQFRSIMTQQSDEEPFSLMRESEMTLEQLIIDYASSNYLYVIPSEIAKIQVNLCSSLPIPKAAWEEIVELICNQNGIDIKPLNSFVKSLVWALGNNTVALKYVTNVVEELEIIEPFERICFVLSLEGSEYQKVHQFLKRFVNERILSLHTIGNAIVMVGEAHEIKEINKLLGFIRQNQPEKSYKLLPIESISAEDLQAILTACFTDNGMEVSNQKSGSCSILIYPMKRYVLLLGSKKDIERAEQIVSEIHSELLTPDQMTIHWYTCKYSEPYELANLLQQVYQMMVQQIDDEKIDSTITTINTPKMTACTTFREGTIPPVCDTAPKLVVNPPKATPPSNQIETNAKNNLPNFIVDPKTGMIIMVVKQCYLEKLRELAKKLDVAKKMVQIEVLLFEKMIHDQTQFGLNIFQLGDTSKSTETGVSWNVEKNIAKAPGILDYLFGRKKIPGVFPAFNFAYHFLISQDDIYIHSNPTITTVNQTPAVIDLIEEQSINMGTVEDPKTSVITNTFVRAQYGTFIQITPTVNIGDEEEDDQQFITLDTNITFDTTSASVDSRPNVNRRHIQNQVRIASGETLILGGLRRKNSEDHVDKIPFLGDIPGFGKLFSYTSLNDKSTEMFIFITPRVVDDSLSDIERLKKMDLKTRPGDTPELLRKLLDAKAIDKEKTYRMSLKQLFSHV